MAEMVVDKGTVKIRMYNTEFGDCFLLGFKPDSKKTRYMLIDFGMYHTTENGTEKLKAVAENIKEDTGGILDLLVITHEHTDHILGFRRANEVFSEIRVKKLWMSWMEEYGDPKVEEIKFARNLCISGLRSALTGLKANAGMMSEKVEHLLGFEGDDDDFNNLAADGDYDPSEGKPGSNRQTMIWLKHYCDDFDYLKAGETPPPCEGFDNVNFYVLGPPSPENLEYMHREGDTDTPGTETYLSADLNDPYLRFASQLAEDQSGKPGLFNGKYEDTEKAGIPAVIYQRENGNWRDLDNMNTEAIGDLALKLNRHTNNTSLVLAIELGDNGKVLLFPGDAEIGNWLSWDILEWETPNGKITKEDLLKRMVFYKTGHHGSINATLKDKGLELAESPDLAAMIPVSREMAKKNDWDIPYGELVKALMDKCRGRVLRSDDSLPEETDKPDNIGSGEWKEFIKSIKTSKGMVYRDFVIEW